MYNRLGKILFSTRLMAFLFLAFATAMAIGTFVENDYNTDTARLYVYNTWWFEAIMAFFLINFFGNIKRYQLLQREKWATLLLHLSFIFILIGAFVTRYASYEGVMPIREKAAENKVYSEKLYLTALVDGDYKGEMRRRTFEKPLLLSPVSDNDISLTGEFDQKNFSVNIKKYYFDAKEIVAPKADGKLYLKLVESSDGTRHEHWLEEGKVENIHNLLFALNKNTKGAINIDTSVEPYKISMPFDGDFMRMADQMKGKVVKDSVQEMMMRSLYSVGEARFVFPEAAIKGFKTFEQGKDLHSKHHTDVIKVEVTSHGQKKSAVLSGSKGSVGEPQTLNMNGLDISIFFGSKVYDLPFKIKLNDFIATKYPGTEKSYESFESQVTVIDKPKNYDARIYMNHVLDHGGFRFFQSSFDPDEKGTILSVNHDFWGTAITYSGYFMLFFAMMAILFDKHTRFADIKRKLDVVSKKKTVLMFILVFLCQSVSGQQEHGRHASTSPTQVQIDSLLLKFKITEAHADRFGKLVIQDDGGRMKPLNTFSSELLRKVSKSDSYNGMNSDQVFVSMTQFPRVWFEVPIIYIKPGNDSIRKIIGVDAAQKYIAFIKFFDENGNYKLSPYLDEAYKSATPDQFQKDFIETDRKVNLLNSALSGSIMRIFPVPNDENNKWVSYPELDGQPFHGMDSTFVKNVLPLYMQALDSAAIKQNYTNADFYLQSLENYQKKYGSAVRPSDKKIAYEVAYNKYDIFKKLYYLYMLAGVLMLILTIVNIFFEKKSFRIIINIFHILIGVLFALHTLGLIARWYISGHAPWSDAYESMIYVAWATMFFTLAFKRNSKLTVASGTFVASMILMIAHWNWMDPSIANLQPVLNSYWLMIHVAVIVASYGPFTLGMILGMVSLILMIFTNKNNRERMRLHIQEITYINEMALTIGLVMLTIGNFLGGQWANESWGRYWGWDPKETWALISIMIYAFVIHARFVPALRGRWIFNLMSILAFYSIMMTYFGVNFYLTGLHSYASGDKVVTPAFVYWSVAFVAILGAVSYWREKKANAET